MGPRWPGHYFCQFEKSLPQPKIKCNALAISRNPLQSCLVFHSILDYGELRRDSVMIALKEMNSKLQLVHKVSLCTGAPYM